MATAVACFPSGFERDLVTYGAPCAHEFDRTRIECGNLTTYLDAGVPHCANHLIGYCKHGYSGCSTCGVISQGAQILALQAPRRSGQLART